MSLNKPLPSVVAAVQRCFIWPMLMEIMSCRQLKAVDAGVLSYLIRHERLTLFQMLYRVASINTRRMRMAYQNLTSVTLRLIVASAAWSTLQLRTKLPSVVLDCIMDFIVEEPGAFDPRDYEEHFPMGVNRVNNFINRGGVFSNPDGNFDRRVAEACIS